MEYEGTIALLQNYIDRCDDVIGRMDTHAARKLFLFFRLLMALRWDYICILLPHMCHMEGRLFLHLNQII